MKSRAGSRAVLVKFSVGFSPCRAVRLSSSLSSVSFYAVLVKFSSACASCRAVQLSSSLSSVSFYAVLLKFSVGFSPCRAVRLSSSLNSVWFYEVLLLSCAAAFLSRETIVTYLPLLFRLASITGRRL